MTNREMLHKTFDAYMLKAEQINEKEGVVEAIVNTFGIIDKAIPPDIVHPGAFTKTIQERLGRIRILNNHRLDSAKDAIGKPIEIREVGRDELPTELLMKNPSATGGLYAKMSFMLNDPDSLAVYNRLAAGVLNEFSIGFQVIKADWSKELNPETGKEITVRNCREIALWEISPVIFGASETATLNVRNDPLEISDNPDQPESKEVTPDGEYEVQRFGDMLWGMMYGKAIGFASEMLVWGTLSMEEMETVSMAMDTVRDTLKEMLPDDLWQRPISASYAIQLARDLKPDTKNDTLKDEASNQQVELNDSSASEAEPPEALTSTWERDIANRLRLSKPW